MATINLGAIKFNWKGAYNNSTTYAVDDVVSSGGNSYVCIQASQGNAVGNATAYWNIMSSAGTNGTNGTNGTDVGTVITTQGDMLYRDGSGLQRLAKGTANQTLQMNGAANAPTWVTAESGTLVKIATIDHSSNVSAVNFTNCFTADYDIYEVYFSDIISTTNNYELAVGLVDASGSQLANNYMSANYSYIGVASNSSGVGAFGQDNDGRIRLIGENLDNVANEPSNLKLTIYNPYASKHTTTQYTYHIRASNNHYYNVLGTGQNKNATSVRSLKFYQNGGGNFSSYKGTVFGVKR